MQSPVANDGSALLRFDGAAKGNPGPAGCGYAIWGADGTLLRSGGMSLGTKTNNAAEYSGLILGCQEALSLGVRRLRIEGDSLLVCQQVTGGWKVNDRLGPLCAHAKELLSRFESVQVTHIRRCFNAEADRLASLHAVPSPRPKGGEQRSREWW